MLRGYAQRYFFEIVRLLGEVPSDLLLLLKTNDCLRHLDRALGAPVNTAVVIAFTTSDVIFKEEISKASTIADKVVVTYDFLKCRFRAYCYNCFAWGLSMWTRFSGSLMALKQWWWHLY